MKKTPQSVDSFARELKKLMDKHGCYLMGSHRIVFSDSASLDISTHSCAVADTIDVRSGMHVSKDTMGPFLIFSANAKEINFPFCETKPTKITLMDRDKLLRDGILSPIDQKSTFTNRREWAEHLKANGCVEYGNDLNNHKPPSEMRGDFDCREELGKVTHQIMDKYGH